MSSKVGEAVYENGILRLSKPMDLAQGTRVEVVVTPCDIEQSSTTRAKASTRPDPAAILAEIVRMPIEASDQSLHGRDHDAILYGQGEPGS